MSDDTKGPYIVWLNYGCEGWQPTSYPTLKDALLGERYGNSFVITKAVEFETVEAGETR